MESNTLFVVIVVAFLAAGLGYLIAKVLSSKAISTLEAIKDQAELKLRETQDQLSQSKNDLDRVNQEQHNLLQEKVRLETELNHSQSSFQLVTEKFQELERLHQQVIAEKHEAEKQAESSNKLLAQAQSQQAEMNDQIAKEQTVINTLRQSLDEEKSKLAEQGKLAKDYEVQAQQTKEQLSQSD